MKTPKRKPRIMWEIYHLDKGYVVNPRPFVWKHEAIEWNKTNYTNWREHGARKVIVMEFKP
jgi:hypothetical protein